MQIQTMKNLKKMNVSRAITIIVMFFMILSGHSQKEWRFSELKKSDQYNYKINKNEDKIIIYSSTGNSQSFSISLNVEKTTLGKCGDVRSEDYDWLLKNERLKYNKNGENIIEINNFKGLIIYKWEDNKCQAYKVKNRIYIAQ